VAQAKRVLLIGEKIELIGAGRQAEAGWALSEARGGKSYKVSEARGDTGAIPAFGVLIRTTNASFRGQQNHLPLAN
jgi:hypothetical protein